ncbi:MAG: RNA repair transcriptional activator RtcR [Pseudomonadota bacterium]|nr:RNA repair transcriptional activator RtcR [Pseudomonadota bacterium]
MDIHRPTVVLGLLGTNLDRGVRGLERWNKWRPTVGLCRQEDLVVSRIEVLHPAPWASLASLIKADIGTVSPETEVRLHTLDLTDPWDFEAVYTALYDFARAYPFDPDAEDYLVHITTGTHVAQICLFLLVESRHLPARLVQTGPGPTPAGRHGVIDLMLSRYDRLAGRFDSERQEATSFLKGGIETRSAAFNALIDRIELVALRSPAPMLLTGPTGAGKSRLARRIWDLKRARRIVKGAFVEVNCATLRGDGAMAALFGHRRGAFTGAVADRAGLLREADGGMLFLDEIGELGLDEQAMLLRAIEDKRFLPVGSDREVESDFQLLAGTNRDLGRAVAEGRFREDLLARLDLWTFALPGLKDRPEDIPPNVDHELEQAGRASGRRVTFNREAREHFLAFAAKAPWPRNFRDLGGAIVRMSTLAPGARIDRDTVDEEIDRLRATWASVIPKDPARTAVHEDDPVAELLGDTPIDRFDRVQLAEVIRVCRVSRSLSDAGRSLFAASRAQRTSVNDADRLRKYLARFGLDWDGVSARPDHAP